MDAGICLTTLRPLLLPFGRPARKNVSNSMLTNREAGLFTRVYPKKCRTTIFLTSRQSTKMIHLNRCANMLLPKRNCAISPLTLLLKDCSFRASSIRSQKGTVSMIIFIFRCFAMPGIQTRTTFGLKEFASAVSFWCYLIQPMLSSFYKLQTPWSFGLRMHGLPQSTVAWYSNCS